MKTGPVATYKGSESVRDINVSHGNACTYMSVCMHAVSVCVM